MGYSNTRDMTEAAFTFTSAAAIDDPDNHIVTIAGDRDWASHQVTAPVAEDSNTILFGIFLAGRGRIELRNAELTRGT